jgi:hypothetical protein
MDLRSPATLLAAWVLVPLLVVATATGVGLALGRIAGRRLGVLTLPCGFLLGIVVMGFVLQANLPAWPAVALVGVLAVAGVALELRGRRRRPGRPSADAAWVAAAGLGAYLVGLAPVVGSGRSGIPGYVLNNDPSVHLTLIELLRETGAKVVDQNASSFEFVSVTFATGYPLGSHAWGVFATVVTGLDPFHSWAPTMALALAMMAPLAFWVLRTLGAPTWLAAVGAGVVPIGYLPYSYLAQGGLKEILSALAVMATATLVAFAAREDRLSGRSLLPAAVAASATIYVFGLGAIVWLGPLALVALVALFRLLRSPASRLGLVTGIAIALLMSLPALLDGFAFASNNDNALTVPQQVGNLVGPVHKLEMLNVWLAADYRFQRPENVTLTVLGAGLALVLALLGLVYSVRRRWWPVPIFLVAAVAGFLLIESRYAIYFQAKAYVVAGPAAALASAAGVVALWRHGGRVRTAGVLAGAAFALGVLASVAYVYAGAWITPKERFQELAQINERFAGQGPMLVNEREGYAKYLLRDVAPWESWGEWQPDRGLRGGPVPVPAPHTPDFDDYTDAHFERFDLLLDRRKPGGSLPPTGFRPIHRTEHYVVWRRSPGTKLHPRLPIGYDQVSGTGPLDCKEPFSAEFLRSARRSGRPVRVAGTRSPAIALPAVWGGGARFAPYHAPRGFAARLSGHGFAGPKRVPPGRYEVFAQGSFGPGLRVFDRTDFVGETFGDLGLFDGWQPIGTVDIDSREPFGLVLVPLDRPAYLSGSRRPDLTGPLALRPVAPDRWVKTVPAEAIPRLCGRQLDWIELA